LIADFLKIVIVAREIINDMENKNERLLHLLGQQKEGKNFKILTRLSGGGNERDHKVYFREY
jgi:hypothetical protein